MILPLVVFFCLATLFAGSIRLLLVYMTSHYSYAVGTDLSLEVYRRTLHQPYAVHISRNSSEVINGVLNQTWTIVGGVVVPLLSLLTSLVLGVGILIGSLAIAPLVAMTAFLICGVTYGAFVRFTRQKLRKNSQQMVIESGKF